MNIKKHLPWLGALLPIINAQADTNPNVVIIYIDDMGIGDIGCYGGKFVATPNIDKLAQDGLLFNQYYSSAPVSSPSRCGLTTGLFPIEVGINTFLSVIIWTTNFLLWHVLFRMQDMLPDTLVNGTWEVDVMCTMPLLSRTMGLMNIFLLMKAPIRTLR